MDFNAVAEDKIREAIEDGQFDNLAGAGKPFSELEDSTGEDWMGFHILRSNGFLPEWLELRKQIADERDQVVGSFERWRDAIVRYGSSAHVLAVDAGNDYRRLATRINAKIDLHNLRCPSIHLELARFREDAQP